MPYNLGIQIWSNQCAIKIHAFCLKINKILRNCKESEPLTLKWHCIAELSSSANLLLLWNHNHSEFNEYYIIGMLNVLKREKGRK